MAKTLDIVIVNWNAGGLLRRCLDSIAASQGANSFLASVTLVDNASSDGSLDGLDDLALPLEVLRLDANIGYGRAANLGARRGEADFVLFLNPDIALHPDTLGRSLESLQAKTAGGAAQ